MLCVGTTTALRTAAPPELARDVLVRCKARDPMAFRAFVVRYERPVFALLSRMLGHGAHVEDVAQETFLRAFRAFPSFDVDAPSKPSTWILTIATRLALDSKKRAKLTTVPIEDADSAAAGATPETEAHRTQLRASLARATAELSEDQRAAFVLAEFHGLTMGEIASVLEVAENTVKTRLFRARVKLQQSLGSMRDRT
jgi:RNA polymerase sigma-70 factor, ECF subfamily